MACAPIFEQLKKLADVLQQSPRAWTMEGLWRVNAALERNGVRGVNERRVPADVVSLVRHEVMMGHALKPYPERVARRYA